MKKLLLLALVSALSISGFASMNTFSANIELNESETKRTDIELCKTSIKYAHAYKDSMTKDEMAKIALAYYKKDVVANCGRISAASAS